MRKPMSVWILAMLIVSAMGCSSQRDVWVVTEQYHPAWTPEGTIVYLEVEITHLGESTVYSERLWDERRWFLCEMNSDGNNKRRLSEIFRETQSLSVGWPSTLVDGKGRICVSEHSIVFELYNGELWLATRSGLPVRKVSSSASYPSLSPDARMIAFEKDSQGIWIADLLTGTITRIVPSAAFGMPCWSPGAQQIAMMHRGRDLYLYDTESDSVRRLWQAVDTLAGVQFPQWSRNGTRIVCLGLQNLLEFDIDGISQPDTIRTTLAVLLMHPRLSTDGAALIGDGASIYKMDISGSDRVVLAQSSKRKVSLQERD